MSRWYARVAVAIDSTHDDDIVVLVQILERAKYYGLGSSTQSLSRLVKRIMRLIHDNVIGKPLYTQTFMVLTYVYRFSHLHCL